MCIAIFKHKVHTSCLVCSNVCCNLRYCNVSKEKRIKYINLNLTTLLIKQKQQLFTFTSNFNKPKYQ